ncbi:TPA: hypothetical protein JBJ04_13725 [Legionella pneumophila]|nr:hypothetical protein [Legionella pneumophila]
MKRVWCLSLLLTISTGLMANESDCKDAVGLWMGKFSYKNPSLCELKSPELCDRVSIGIGIKSLGQQNKYVADLYPQRGVAGSITLQCENGQLSTIQGDPQIPPGTTISYKCDELENCVVKYEDFRLKSKLLKLWQEDIRV